MPGLVDQLCDGGKSHLLSHGQFVDPWPRLQPPSRPPPSAGADKTVRPAKPSQMLDAPRFRPEPGRKIQKSSHPLPLTD
jgi:hypothetical protein